MKHLKSFDGLLESLNTDESVWRKVPKDFSSDNWNAKVDESIADLSTMKTTLDKLKKEFESKYNQLTWNIHPTMSSWNKINFGYELTFESNEYHVTRFISLNVWYNTDKLHNYSNSKEIKSKTDKPYSIEIYYYPEIEAYGTMSKDNNPTIREYQAKPYVTSQIKKMTSDMDAKFTYLKNKK